MPAIRHACPVQGCDTTLTRKADVKRHLKMHDEAAQNRWACSFDGCKTRAMRQRSNMVYHIWNTHASDSSPTRTHRSTPPSRSAKIPLGLARLVEGDRVDSVSSVQACMGAFRVSDPLNVDSTPAALDSVPSLSPSNSTSDSMSSASDSSPIRTHRSTSPSKSAKIPLELARLVEADRVDSVSGVQARMGAFHVSDTHDMSSVPCKAEEQGYSLNVDSTPSALDSVPSLSPSSSASSSMSPPSLEYVPCPTFGYDLPTASTSTASDSFNDSGLVTQSISVTNSMYLEVLSTPSCDINAYPEPLPTIPVHDDVYSLQYWNALAPTFIPAYGLVNPLTDFQPELQSDTPFDFGLNSTDPSAYFPVNEPSYGAHMLEQSPEYQTTVVGVPPMYPNSHDLSYGDLFVPSVDATAYSGLDFSYFDPSWNVPVPLETFDALNYF